MRRNKKWVANKVGMAFGSVLLVVVVCILAFMRDSAFDLLFPIMFLSFIGTLAIYLGWHNVLFR